MFRDVDGVKIPCRLDRREGRDGNIRGSFHNTITTGREDEMGVPWAVLAHSHR